MDSFTKSYIETSLWSSTDSEGETLDSNYGEFDIAEETKQKMIFDCEKFQKENADLIGTNHEQAGHDFWLTRNRHGCGFWDGDWEDSIGKKLTEASHKFGELNLYVGDDGKIYY